MCCQNSSNTLFLASSLISLHSRFDAFLQAFEVHLGPTALGCFVTNSPSFLRLLAYALPSILSCFCLFCFHFDGSACLALGFFLSAPALSRWVFPFFAAVGRNVEKQQTNKDDNWINYWEQQSEINRLQLSKTKHWILTGISTQRTCVWWGKLGDHLWLCCHHRVGPFIGRSIRFPARITDLQMVWIKHTHLVKTCQWYGSVFLPCQKKEKWIGIIFDKMLTWRHIIPNRKLNHVTARLFSCQNDKLIILS